MFIKALASTTEQFTLDYGPDFVFQLWEHWISHQMLLLRCPKSATRDHNIDLVFAGVDYVSIPTSMRGLTVSRIDSYEGLTCPCPYVRNHPEHENIFLLTSEDADHLIVAAFMQLHITEWEPMKGGQFGGSSPRCRTSNPWRSLTE